ncbi:hypothetical protein HDK90DRAFT_279495 [Phyllosticta capitalensis]|uniref:Secreted protein n=1 Tax=Phyllosticta capitalensis TaxID=121624 RepID=A0ABR1YND7_9PEZI
MCFVKFGAQIMVLVVTLLSSVHRKLNASRCQPFRLGLAPHPNIFTRQRDNSTSPQHLIHRTGIDIDTLFSTIVPTSVVRQAIQPRRVAQAACLPLRKAPPRSRKTNNHLHTAR